MSSAELNSSDSASPGYWPHLGLSGLPKDVVERITDFNNPKQEWRRLFSEVMGTFLLLLVAAGSGIMNAAFGDPISRTAAVVAPGLMVMAMILFMGRVSGAHFNPAVSVAFALRGDFPWRRVPGYIVAQFAGAVLAVLLLQAVIGESASNGATYPAQSTTDVAAFLMEVILTFGLVSVILGTASGAQNVGIIGALGVGGYVALAGLWASPLSGASMNPIRSLAPDLVASDFTSYWVYLAGPLLGAALAVVAAYMLRGRGGGLAGSQAAQGGLFTQAKNPEKA
jgi:aquaporin Z